MDTLSPGARSENMRRIKSKGMEPERIVRRMVFRLGYRYRLHGKHLPGKPDLVFAGRKKVIFVHGCFWHQHKKKSCPIVRQPKSNLVYWLPKLERNTQRDTQHLRELRRMGWGVLVVWECQCANETKLCETISAFLGEPSVRCIR